jgi:hypothetical protein
MSTYVGRILRVYTGWRAMPGKNLVIFDDYLVEARASALEGLTTRGAASAGARAAGARRNAALDTVGPEELTNQHPDNWRLATADITSAQLSRKGIGIKTRLTLETKSGMRTIEWEARSNNDQQIIAALKRVLGDKFSVASKR